MPTPKMDRPSCPKLLGEDIPLGWGCDDVRREYGCWIYCWISPMRDALESRCASLVNFGSNSLAVLPAAKRR